MALRYEGAMSYYENGLWFYNLGRYCEAVNSFAQARRMKMQELVIKGDEELVIKGDEELVIKGDEDLAFILNAEGAALNLLANSPSPEHMKKKYNEAKKRFEIAIMIFEKLIRNNHRSKNNGDLNAELALAYHNKGYALGQLRMYEKALKSFIGASKSFELYSDKGYKTERADVWRNIGWCEGMIALEKGELNEKRFKKVKKAFTRAIREDKDYAIAYNTAGYVYEMFSRSREAIEQYKIAIEKDPHMALPWYNTAYAICGMITSEHGDGHVHADDKDKDEYKKAIQYLDYSIKLDPSDPWSWYYKGHVLYNGLSKLDEALNDFQKTLEIDPKFLYALYNIGLIHNDEEKYEEAIRYFDRSLDCIEKIQEVEGLRSILEDPKAVEVGRKIAKALENEGIRLIVDLEMTKAVHLQQLVNSCIENEKIERKFSLTEAESLIVEAHKMTRGYVLETVTCILYHKGIACNALGEQTDRKTDADKRNRCFDEAIKCFEKTVTNLEKIKNDFEKAKNDSADELDEIHLMLGLAYHKLGYTHGNKEDYRSAEDCFDKSDKIFSQIRAASQKKYKREMADMYRTFGFVCSKQKNHSKAYEKYSLALELDPTLAYAHDSRGNHTLRYFNDEKFKRDVGKGLEDALNDFQNAIKLFKVRNGEKEIRTRDIKYPFYSMGFTYYLLAKNQKDILKKKESYDNAIESFSSATEIDKGFDYAWFNKGVSLFERSQLTKELWSRADGKTTYDIKYSDLIIGTEYGEAIRCFDEVLRIDANFKDAWYNKGVVLYYLKRYEEAIRCFDEVLRIEEKNSVDALYNKDKKNSVDALYNKGVILYYLKRYEEAIRCFDGFDVLLEKHNEESSTPLKCKEIWSLFYKAKSSYFLGRDHKYDTNKKSKEAIQFAEMAGKKIVSCKNENIECDLSESRLWLFKASCMILAKDCDNASEELKEINNGAFQELQDDEKIQYYNIKGICSYEEGHDNEALNWFKKAKEKADFMKSQFPPVTPYYNLAMLYHKQTNSEKARKTLEEYKNQEDSTIKEAKMKMEHQTGGGSGTDWYNWWFSRGKYKRAMGLMLLAALGVMLLPIPYAIVSNQMDTSANYNLENNIKTFEHFAYFGTIAIIVGILLMPNITKFKVGTGIEFEAAAPQIIDPSNLDDPILRDPILSDKDSDLVKRYEMPIKYVTQAANPMPLKYQRRRFQMPINSIKMPVARGFIKVS